MLSLGLTRAALAAAVLALLPALGGAGPVLFGLTFHPPSDPSPEQLVRIDPSTGAATAVGPLETRMLPFGLGTRDGRLYTYDSAAGRVRELDPSSGATLATIDIGTSGLIGEGGMDFRSDGTGFLAHATPVSAQLWSFDVEAGTATSVSGPDGLSPRFDGLAFEPGSDALFGISQMTYLLYRIDPSTGMTQLVGATGIASGRAQLAGLAFAGDGTLYLAAVGNLYTLDTSTGLATLVGPTGFDDVAGLTFVDMAEPIAEPGTMVLLGAGLVGLALRARSKRR